jgi:uncharacterized RDD family membrane protein YckC
MTCSYCGTRNGEGEHRCRRCGRRPGDRLTGEFMIPQTDGALAQAPVAVVEPVPRLQLQTPPKLSRTGPPALHSPRHAVQRSLFHETPASKVIPIAFYAPGLAETDCPRVAKPPRRKPVHEAQSSLDFLPPLPPKPRTLSTTVDAVIYCESPVATTLHRAVASALDWSMVLIGYGLFLMVFRLLGGEFVLTKPNLIAFGGMLLVTGFTYGLFFAMAGAETPGMHWTQLRLTTFDGFPTENRTRFVRFGAACLSRCTLLGLLWSLADEECLSWQDHISRTFPTPRRSESEIFRRR